MLPNWPASLTRGLSVYVERWPVSGSFVIARGAKTFVDVVVVEIEDGHATGRGEATPIYYHGETATTVVGQVESFRQRIETRLNHSDILAAMPRGAARNAVDAALWDLASRSSGISAWERLDMAPPAPLVTAFTLSLDTPDAMYRAAIEAAPHHPFLKLKLAGEGDGDRVAAVRQGAPRARLVVDANEAWTGRDLAAEAQGLVPYGVELIEQPVRAGADHLLDGVPTPIPFCADESMQDRADLNRCIGRYGAINIKLDKAGGLTEALALAEAARGAGLKIMVGCMLSTSLGIAPAFLAAQQAEWIDLDGPLLLACDREGGFRFANGYIYPASKGFWA